MEAGMVVSMKDVSCEEILLKAGEENMTMKVKKVIYFLRFEHDGL